MDYNSKEVEAKWKAYWADNGIYKVTHESDKPKYYVLDMFPYPSGAFWSASRRIRKANRNASCRFFITKYGTL